MNKDYWSLEVCWWDDLQQLIMWFKKKHNLQRAYSPLWPTNAPFIELLVGTLLSFPESTFSVLCLFFIIKAFTMSYVDFYVVKYSLSHSVMHAVDNRRYSFLILEILKVRNPSTADFTYIICNFIASDKYWVTLFFLLYLPFYFFNGMTSVLSYTMPTSSYIYFCAFLPIVLELYWCLFPGWKTIKTYDSI